MDKKRNDRRFCKTVACVRSAADEIVFNQAMGFKIVFNQAIPQVGRCQQRCCVLLIDWTPMAFRFRCKDVSCADVDADT